MRHRTKTLFETGWLKLVSSTNPTTGRKHYIIKLLSMPQTGLPHSIINEIRALFDPGKNRGSAMGLSWKYRNRKEAEKLITLALLNWGE